ncbi:tRNA-splicing endonuclease subunit Sen34 [Sigmodon hispidus]
MLVVEVANGRSLVPCRSTWESEARTVGALPRAPPELTPGPPAFASAPHARIPATMALQEQSTLAAEAHETRRQELLEKIVEGQAPKKQKLEQDSGADEGQEAGGSEATQGGESSDDGQASTEQEGAESSSSPDSSFPQPGPSNGVTLLPRSALLIRLATARPWPVKAKPLDWPHAGRPAHELRYSIYRDLWERGFFLSAAGKFGGDFLVYLGDPLRFHTHYIAQCWVADDPIPLQDLVSAGRLGTSVRKTLLLCSPQPDGKVVYTSLQWASLQ